MRSARVVEAPDRGAGGARAAQELGASGPRAEPGEPVARAFDVHGSDDGRPERSARAVRGHEHGLRHRGAGGVQARIRAQLGHRARDAPDRAAPDRREQPAVTHRPQVDPLGPAGQREDRGRGASARGRTAQRALATASRSGQPSAASGSASAASTSQ